jgi:hypothetical protein
MAAVGRQHIQRAAKAVRYRRAHQHCKQWACPKRSMWNIICAV